MVPNLSGLVDWPEVGRGKRGNGPVWAAGAHARTRSSCCTSSGHLRMCMKLHLCEQWANGAVCALACHLCRQLVPNGPWPRTGLQPRVGDPYSARKLSFALHPIASPQPGASAENRRVSWVLLGLEMGEEQAKPCKSLGVAAWEVGLGWQAVTALHVLVTSAGQL